MEKKSNNFFVSVDKKIVLDSYIIKYYIGKSYDNKKYKILKNDNIKNLKVGLDYHIYAKKEEKMFGTVLIPISDDEAGVVDVHREK